MPVPNIKFERPYGPFGTMLASVSAFIIILTLMDAEALAGFAMPARTLAFSAILYILLLNADAQAGIAMPARASASISAIILVNAEAMSGFVPKSPRVFWMPVPNIQKRKMLLGYRMRFFTQPLLLFISCCVLFLTEPLWQYILFDG